ncbi:MAG: SDR family oxidoreductase [Thermoanaerobaculales bacterium]|nr:SDR family oxidoreductase [Thermoanaerobaculales bacterium]
MSEFKDLKFLVTGGSSGIGLSVAQFLCRGDALVCIVGRRQEALDEAVADLGERAWSCRCDIADAAQVGSLAEMVAARWGSLDGLVNNAGIAPMADLEGTQVEMWDETFAVNARGPYLMTRALLPLLRAAQTPSVVNVSSTLAEKAIPGMVAYNSAKAALNQFTRSVALELAPKVRVNAVMPAVVDTPIHLGRGMSSAQVKGMGRIHPLGRVGTPEDVAELVCFLLSGRSSWITGAILPIDGGMMAT